jgi:RND family efflux transporter MFP subunit
MTRLHSESFALACRRLAWAMALAAALPLAAQPVATTTVQVASGGATYSLDGSLEALRQSTVAAQASGNVLALAVKAGDAVKAGQALVRIDARETQAGLAAAEAGVAQAEAVLANAQTQAERARELRRQGFVSQAALDTTETQWRAASAGASQARAARSQAALARSFASADAPFDGVVLATHVEAGDLASPGRPLVTLYVPGRLRAVVQVPASRSALARAATGVEVRLPDGRWVTPAARTELPTADPVSQTVEWRLDLAPDATPGLSPGQAVGVRFNGAVGSGAGAKPVLPAAAVLQRGELTAVYAVQGDRFVLKAVRLGAPVAGGVELLAGLKAGERVALDPVRAGLAGAVPAPQ